MSRNYELLNNLHSASHVTASPMRAKPRIASPDDGAKFRNAPVDRFHLLLAVRRHWLFGVGFLVIVVAVTAAVTFLSSPVYEPTAKIEVDPPGTEIFSLQSENSGATDIDRIIETQTQILNSDELAIKVIRELRLDTRKDIVSKPATTASSSTSDRLSPAESAALKYVRKHLKAAPIKNSRTIQVSFASHDPALSRDVVNSLVGLYLNKNYQTRFDAVTRSSEWLSRQLVDIRRKAEESNRALADYQKTHNIAEIGDEQSTFALRAGELSRQLTQAGADRIQLEAYDRAIKENKGDSLPQVRDSPVIQDLTKNIAKTQAELSQAEAIYGKNHPNVHKLKSAAASLEEQLRRERNSILAGIQTSYAAAKAREQLMKQQLKAVTADAGAMSEYSVLKHEAQTNTDLYNTLYARVKEAGITAASKSSNVRVLEEARLLDRPTRPVPAQNMLLALVLGLVGGIATIFLRDRFDTSLRTPEELQEFETLPTIAFVPRVSTRLYTNSHKRLYPALQRNAQILRQEQGARSVPSFVVDTPNCSAAEAIRTLVSSLVAQDQSPSVLLVSSALPREGKTTVAVNLALAFSELDETCIVDADLRRPAVAMSFGLESEPGLGTVLRGDAPLDAMLRPCSASPKLQIVPAGRASFNPGAILMTPSINELIQQLRQRFRYIVIDSPPILAYADARALAPLADGVILVGRYGYTARDGIKQAINVLRELRASVRCFVLNDVDATAGHSYYGYYRGYESVTGT